MGSVKAVDGVSFTVAEGETIGLVGESGCGKSTLARSILQLLRPTSGSVRFRGTELTDLSRRQMRPLRREMQMIFQDPYASLNPRKRVGQIVGEPIKFHGLASGDELKRRVQELLERVGLASEHYNRFPHEFSGGQRQRIGVARALALEPKMIIADEPVSALDVSIQAQIINLLEDLQGEFDLTYVFVAHDLGVVRHVSDRIAVMYLGKIVEIGPADDVYSNPIHPYTVSLLSAVPIPDPRLNQSSRADRARGRRAEPGQPAFGLPLPHPLPAGDRRLQRGRAAAGRLRSRPLGRLSPPGRPERARDRRGACGRRSRLSAGTAFRLQRPNPPPTARAGQRVGYAGSALVRPDSSARR